MAQLAATTTRRPWRIALIGRLGSTPAALGYRRVVGTTQRCQNGVQGPVFRLGSVEDDGLAGVIEPLPT